MMQSIIASALAHGLRPRRRCLPWRRCAARRPPAAAARRSAAAAAAAVGHRASAAIRGHAAALAVPDFIALGDAETTAEVAKTLGQVLWDDLAFEREFT